MSDQPNNNTDSASFASILAGIQRLRGENVTATAPAQPQAPTARPQPPSHQVRPQPVPSIQQSRVSSSEQRIGQKRVNAFNRDKSRSGSAGPITKVSAIEVNKNQKGNPLLEHVTLANWSYVESHHPFDYHVNSRNVVFLSIKYHKLHPEYISNKMKPLVKKNAILLTVVDVENTESIIRDLNRICLYNEFTLLLAFSYEQAAKYLTYLATTPKRVIRAKAP